MACGHTNFDFLSNNTNDIWHFRLAFIDYSFKKNVTSALTGVKHARRSGAIYFSYFHGKLHRNQAALFFRYLWLRQGTHVGFFVVVVI